jgi:DNA helicase-2/ATP-dependent DNA helicase PcrA
MKNSNFTPSKYQAAVFAWIQNVIKLGKAAAAMIMAVAGSGKTTTILQMLQFVPTTWKVIFLAFNKNIANELAQKVPANVFAKTFNAAWHGTWLYHVKTKYMEVDQYKVRNQLKKNILSPEDYDLYGAFVSNLVGKAKGAGVGYLVPNVSAEWYKLIDHFDLNLDSDDADMNRAIEIAQEALAYSIQTAYQIIDFDDQLYMPLIKNLRGFQNDLVLVDESQDLNAVQQALLKRMLKPNGILVFVGDERQAIYGFRGADSAAMKKMKEAFDAVTLPLYKCYRCSKAVVKAAQRYVSEIEFAEDAPEGSEQQLFYHDAKVFKSTDAIICRNNAPLVQMAYKLIARGVGCKVLGREIGENLVNLINKMKAKGIEKLIVKLEAYKAREIAKLTSQGHEDRAGAIEDKIECLMVVINSLDENNRTVPALIDRIENMFQDKVDKRTGKANPDFAGILTLCSAHKSKGLEFERVFILDAHQYMPSKWARQQWQKEQEINLIYVAITRAKVDLFWLDSEGWEKTAPKEEKAVESTPDANKEEVNMDLELDGREAYIQEYVPELENV